jgi:hypothetical protein
VKIISQNNHHKESIMTQEKSTSSAATKQSAFATLAHSMMKTGLESTISMNEVQSETRKQFMSAKEAIEARCQQIEAARREAHRSIDEESAKLRKECDDNMSQLKTEYHKELVRLGIREEDIPLIDRDVVKTVDAVTKKSLGAFGKFIGYIKDGVKEGMVSSQ